MVTETSLGHGELETVFYYSATTVSMLTRGVISCTMLHYDYYCLPHLGKSASFPHT